MSNSNEFQDAVTRALWQGDGQGQGRIYAILDAARAPIIYSRLAESDNRKVCLFIGDQARELATVAPYLVELDETDSFTQWILEKGWGKSWGIFVESNAPFIKLRNSLRTFLKVADEDGKTFFFRYYDPRVLCVFLPACDADQLETLFGAVVRYYSEGKDKDTLIQFSVRDNKLVESVTNLTG
ncbi:MAG: DUF4123 domain-containing protein [Desulfobacteraceae bacterium]|nr:DUF4123 domain-containing protein [Desulfobacteraceae bacterium]